MSSYSTTGVQVTAAWSCGGVLLQEGESEATEGRGRLECGAWPAPSTISSRAPGMPRATCSARGRPRSSRAPAMTRVGVSTSASRSWSGSMLPCPAPRRLAARPAGRSKAIARRRAARAGGRAAWLAKTGSRSHSSTNAAIPSRSMRVAGPRRRRGGRAFLRRGHAGGRALEDETADDLRVHDGEAERDPGAERVSEDVRGDRRQVAAGSWRGRPPSVRRSCAPAARCPTGRDRAGPR